MFLDEFGYSALEPLRRTWAPRGERPVIWQRAGDRRMLTGIVGLTWSGHIYTHYVTGGMASCNVVAFLKHLLRYCPDGFILVCDHASIHTGEETVRFLFDHLEIVVEPLPKYAPDLNPEEYCHGNVKEHLANATPADATEMRRRLEAGFARLRRRPDLLLSFIHAAGLGVNQLWLN